jgi:hypothetical protein
MHIYGLYTIKENVLKEPLIGIEVNSINPQNIMNVVGVGSSAKYRLIQGVKHFKAGDTLMLMNNCGGNCYYFNSEGLIYIVCAKQEWFVEL